MKKNKHLLAIVYGCILSCFTIYVLLDTFVIPREYVQVEKNDTDDNENNDDNDWGILGDNNSDDDKTSGSNKILTMAKIHLTIKMTPVSPTRSSSLTIPIATKTYPLQLQNIANTILQSMWQM